MTSKQLLSWAGVVVAIAGTITSLAHVIPGTTGVIILAIGTGAAAFGDSIINSEKQ